MSFRGTYPNRSRRSGGFYRAKKTIFSDRDQSFKNHYGDRHNSPHFRNTRGGFKDQVDRNDPHRNLKLDEGRARGRFSNIYHGHHTRPFRGRFPRRGHAYRGPNSESHPSSFNRNRDSLKDDYWSDEDQVSMEDPIISCDERSLHNFDDYYEGEECADEENVTLDRPLAPLSPLIIHRKFGSTESFENLEMSLDRRSPAPLIVSPSLRFNKDLEREDMHSKGYKRNLSRTRSVTPVNKNEKKSFHVVRRRTRDRSHSSTRRRRKSRSLSAGSLERQRSSVEKQLKYEKKRRQMLEHQKRRHEKRSESSIERFLDDCKRSFEENLRTTSSGRKSSRDQYYHRSVSREGHHFKRTSCGRKSNSPSKLRQHSPTGSQFHHLDTHNRPSKCGRKHKKRTGDRKLSPRSHGSLKISHRDSQEKNIDLSENYRSSGENQMSLSPISHRTLDVCRLDLSPISLEDNLEVRNQCDRTHSLEKISSLSSVSPTRSSERLSNSYLKSNADQVERPKSTDSMQEFLAELERSCERSRSSSERSFLLHENALKNTDKLSDERTINKPDDSKHKLPGKHVGPVDTLSFKKESPNQASNLTNKVESCSKVSQFSFKSGPEISKPSYPSGLKVSGMGRENLVFPNMADQNNVFKIYNAPVDSMVVNSQFHDGVGVHGLNTNYQDAVDAFHPNAGQTSGIMGLPFPQPMFYPSPVVVPPYFPVSVPEAPSSFTHYQNILIIQNQNPTGDQLTNNMNSNQNIQSIPTVGKQYPSQISTNVSNAQIYHNTSTMSGQNPSFGYRGDSSTDILSTKQGKINPNQNPQNLIVPGESKQQRVTEDINLQNQTVKCLPNIFNQGVEQCNTYKGLRTLSGIPKAETSHKEMSPGLIDIKNYLGKTFRDGYLSEIKDIIVISDEDSDDEHNDNLQQAFPDTYLVRQYANTTLASEKFGSVFDGFVIYFGITSNSDLEKDPFNVIQESFAASDRFGRLNVEEMPEKQDFLPVPKQVCILRWHGIMLARASDYSRERARQKAAIMLINNLAHNCYTVQAKYSYYRGGRLPKFMMDTTEKRGEYKIVTSDEMINAVRSTLQTLKQKGVDYKYCLGNGVDPTNIRVVLNFIDEFFKNKRRQSELIFGGRFSEFTVSELDTIIRHADSVPWLQWRSIRGRGMYTAVSCKFTPQQLCKQLLKADGETTRHKLLPPQPPWIELLMPDCQFSPNIKSLPNVKPHDEYNAQPFKRSHIENNPGVEKRGKWF